MDPQRDAPRQLEFTQDDYTVVMSREGEHNFFYLTTPQGSIQNKFRGAYTNYEAAKLAIDHIFEDRKKTRKKEKK